jgi:hypothetical protein
MVSVCLDVFSRTLFGMCDGALRLGGGCWKDSGVFVSDMSEERNCRKLGGVTRQLTENFYAGEVVKERIQEENRRLPNC